MIIRAAVTCSDFKKFMQVSVKNHLQFLAMPISTTTDARALKFFPDTIQLIKTEQCETFVNQFKIDRIVSNHLSSCNMHQLKIISNDRL